MIDEKQDYPEDILKKADEVRIYWVQHHFDEGCPCCDAKMFQGLDKGDADGGQR